MASREQELSALPQAIDPPRGWLSQQLARLINPYMHGEARGPVQELAGRLIYPFLRGEAPKPLPPFTPTPPYASAARLAR
jgi:formate dehydrogenase iron-sulfur subunit